jgi:hypothetical protein
MLVGDPVHHGRTSALDRITHGFSERRPVRKVDLVAFGWVAEDRNHTDLKRHAEPGKQVCQGAHVRGIYVGADVLHTHQR